MLFLNNHSDICLIKYSQYSYLPKGYYTVNYTKNNSAPKHVLVMLFFDFKL